MKIFIQLMLMTFVMSQSPKHIKMNNTPLNNNAVTLTERGTFKDQDEGFYRSIDTGISPDGKVVILDRGNYKINIFKQDGTFIRNFGQEGTGPGELTNAGRIIALKNRIILQNFDHRIVLYDYMGNLIKEIRETNVIRSTILGTEYGFMYFNDGTFPHPFREKHFDENGKELKVFKDPTFEERRSQLASSNDDYVNRLPEITKRLFHTPVDLTPYGEGYVRHYQGDYKLEKLDHDMNVTAIITRPFYKIKENYDQLEAIKEAVSNRSKEEQKRIISVNQARLFEEFKYNKGYKNDIQEIIGVYNGYIFLSVASEKDIGSIQTGISDGSIHDIIIDVITPDNELLSTIHTINLDVDRIKELSWVTMIENKLVFEMHSDDEGPYVKVFDINITP